MGYLFNRSAGEREEVYARADKLVRDHLQGMRKRANDIRLRRTGLSQAQLDFFEEYNKWYDWGSGYTCGMFFGELYGMFNELWDYGFYEEFEQRAASLYNEFRFLAAYAHQEEHHTHDAGEEQ